MPSPKSRRIDVKRQSLQTVIDVSKYNLTETLNATVKTSFRVMRRSLGPYYVIMCRK